MGSIKEIRNRIKSVQDTRKITTAMYMISSTKLRKARKNFEATRPYFDAISHEIKRIFRIDENVQSRYFYPKGVIEDLEGTYGYLVITADKGLAGAYNQNVIREAERMLSEHEDNLLFVVGECGRHYFTTHHIPIEQSFRYTAQNPTLYRAREITNVLLDKYDSGEITKIYVIFTDYQNSYSEEAEVMRLLPFHKADFNIAPPAWEKKVKTPFKFMPNLSEVLNNTIESYVLGIVYGALVDSFCSEQSARMNAMDSANRNSQEILNDLKVQYNHTRQSMITQEITEISAGAKAMKRKRERKAMDRQRELLRMLQERNNPSE
ncbi:MAG: ATP synthase F1 subunit gamma [Lachnospiraceae bacterium]|nr:ATP synthase F1 subunit gamma [Lachnospiraceae bacterium]